MFFPSVRPWWADPARCRGVPRLSIPDDMPREVQTVIDCLGNRARTEILRQLATKPMTAMELATALGFNHASIHRHLKALEDAGLVQADQPSGRRVGVTVHWSTDAANVTTAAHLWLAYVSGNDSAPGRQGP